MMQIFSNNGNNSRLIVGGISLSLLGVLSFAANRIVRVLKMRKAVSMSRHAMKCAPASGSGAAPAVKAAKAQRTEASRVPCEEEIRDEIPVHPTAKRLINVMGFVRVGGRLERPPVGDQFVYLDE